MLSLRSIVVDHTEPARGRMLFAVARYAKNFIPAKRLKSDEYTLVLYHFDEGKGMVTKDASENGNDGQIFGAKWVKQSD